MPLLFILPGKNAYASASQPIRVLVDLFYGFAPAHGASSGRGRVLWLSDAGVLFFIAKAKGNQKKFLLGRFAPALGQGGHGKHRGS